MPDNFLDRPDRHQPAPLLKERLRDDDASEGGRRGRRLALVLALLCGAGILLASFYPFQRIHDPDQLARQWQRFLTPWSVYSPATLRFRLGHMIENFFFYFPLGLTVGLALRRDARGRGAAWMGTLALGLGFAMSLSIEFLQVGFSSRDPDLMDTAMNTLGYLAGFLLMRRAVRHHGLDLVFSRWFRALDDQRWLVRVAGLVYATLLLLAAIYPLEPLMEMSRFMGRMGLPSGFLFRSYPDLLEPWTRGRMAGVALFVLLYAPLGFFVRSAVQRWSLLRLGACLLTALGLAATMQAGWWFDPARILGAGVGALAGICLAYCRERRAQMRPRSL